MHRGSESIAELVEKLSAPHRYPPTPDYCWAATPLWSRLTWLRAKDASDVSQQSFITDVLFQPGLEPLWWQKGALIRLREPSSVVLLLRADRAMGKIKAVGERGAVELLAEGQQVVVDGYHPRSLNGSPVRWTWDRRAFSFRLPVADLPVIPAAELEALMQRIAVSGLLDAPLPRASVICCSSQTGRRALPYDATKRLHTMVEKHEGLSPAGHPRASSNKSVAKEAVGHDALVAIAGRLVLEGWSDQGAILLAAIVNDRFGEGDRVDEIIKALGRARKRVTERAEKKGPAKTQLTYDGSGIGCQTCGRPVRSSRTPRPEAKRHRN